MLCSPMGRNAGWELVRRHRAPLEEKSDEELSGRERSPDPLAMPVHHW